ncbi:fascin-like [Emydura macquarii macquarii]|uniref:fascin-like n=1 Tax=Emydura macquarii macquarii TaxID=1129001 RepID=UPI00352A69BD
MRLLLPAGADIYANATAVGNTELFQLVLNDLTKQACFRSSSGTYLGAGPKDAVVSTSTQDKGVWFSLQYQEQKVTLRTADNRYVATRPNGQLLLAPEAAGKKEMFLLLLVNRPLLILQSEAGFVGLFPGTQRLDGNRPAYDASVLTFSEDGFCHFTVAHKYWSLDKDGLVMASGDRPSDFTLQFVSSSCLVLKAPNSKYLVAEAGGRLWAGASDAASATPFHY